MIRKLTHRGRVVAVALVVPSACERLALNIYLEKRKPALPVRAFADGQRGEEMALDWLEELLEKRGLG